MGNLQKNAIDSLNFLALEIKTVFCTSDKIKL